MSKKIYGQVKKEVIKRTQSSIQWINCQVHQWRNCQVNQWRRLRALESDYLPPPSQKKKWGISTSHFTHKPILLAIPNVSWGVWGQYTVSWSDSLTRSHCYGNSIEAWCILSTYTWKQWQIQSLLVTRDESSYNLTCCYIITAWWHRKAHISSRHANTLSLIHKAHHFFLKKMHHIYLHLH